jgi:hypothetical protein
MPRLVKSKSRRGEIAAPLTVEKFKYADQLNIPLPSLILGIEVKPWEFEKPDMQRVYNFKPGRTWVNLAHQTAGIGCHQHYIHATVLTPVSEKVRYGMTALQEKWLDSNVGAFGVGLKSLNDYSADLRHLFGADCNQSHRCFEEGIYPIDVEYVKDMVADDLPKDLDDLIEWKDGWSRALGCINRFGFWVIGENCD